MDINEAAYGLCSLRLMTWKEARCFRRVWLMMPHRQRKQFIQPSFRLIRRPGNKFKLCINRALVVLEGCACCPEKQDAGERESVIQPLACVQVQKYGFEPFFA